MMSSSPAQFGVDTSRGSERALRVVVADDDHDLRTELASALIEDGCVVTEARDGYELLAVLAEWATSGDKGGSLDAIVTDVMMPGFSGLDVLTALQRHLIRVPIVVVTAFGDARTCRAAESLGSVSVLKKPFTMGELRAALARSLRAASEPPSTPGSPRDS